MDIKLVDRIFAVLIAVIALSSIPASAVAGKPVQATVTISSPAYVKAGTVHLKDIAVIDCKSDELRVKLEKVIVGPAPQPGNRNKVRKDLLVVRIRQQKVDPEIVELNVPAVIELVSAVKEFSALDVYQSAIKAVALRTGIAPDELECRAVRMPSRLLSLDPDASLSSEIVNVENSNRFTVKVYTATGDSTTAVIDLLTKTADESKAATQSGAMEGIRKGQEVVVVASSGGVTITVQGVASESAGIGQSIKVLIPSSRKTLYGIVEDTRTVSVSVP